jgi:Fe-S-cluster containining protein
MGILKRCILCRFLNIELCRCVLKKCHIRPNKPRICFKFEFGVLENKGIIEKIEKTNIWDRLKYYLLKSR